MPAFRKTQEELDVFAATFTLPETGHDDNDAKNNEDDPRDEKRPSAGQKKREQCRADERSRRQKEGFHRATGCQASNGSAARASYRTTPPGRAPVGVPLRTTRSPAIHTPSTPSGLRFGSLVGRRRRRSAPGRAAPGRLACPARCGRGRSGPGGRRLGRSGGRRPPRPGAGPRGSRSGRGSVGRCRRGAGAGGRRRCRRSRRAAGGGAAIRRTASSVA